MRLSRAVGGTVRGPEGEAPRQHCRTLLSISATIAAAKSAERGRRVAVAREQQPVQAWLVERGWLRRVVHLTGRVEATVEYDARSLRIGVRPREIIRVNGVEVRTEQFGGHFEAHFHAFGVPRGARANE